MINKKGFGIILGEIEVNEDIKIINSFKRGIERENEKKLLI